MEKGKSCCCSPKATCIATISLCISLFILGILVGCCMAKCSSKSKKCKSQKTCISSGDATSGSTCSYKVKCSKKAEKCSKGEKSE